MEFKIDATDEGFELTLGSKVYVYPTLTKVLARIERAVMATDAEKPQERS